jgi:DnaJ family protein C protein 27
MQVVFVAASKVDLPGRKVTEKEGRDWAAVHNFPYFEVRLKVQAGQCMQYRHS